MVYHADSRRLQLIKTKKFKDHKVLGCRFGCLLDFSKHEEQKRYNPDKLVEGLRNANLREDFVSK
eukprot:7090860-Lingulodinium_polyedra.AAC.1